MAVPLCRTLGRNAIYGSSAAEVDFFSPSEQKQEKILNILSIEITPACKNVCDLAPSLGRLLLLRLVGTPSMSRTESKRDNTQRSLAIPVHFRRRATNCDAIPGRSPEELDP
jgi:hypothetical protein